MRPILSPLEVIYCYSRVRKGNASFIEFYRIAPSGLPVAIRCAYTCICEVQRIYKWNLHAIEWIPNHSETGL
jgi:hypothetical protein